MYFPKMWTLYCDEAFTGHHEPSQHAVCRLTIVGFHGDVAVLGNEIRSSRVLFSVVTCVHPLDSHSSTIVLFALDKTLKSPQTVMGWQSIISHESNRLTRFFRNGLNTRLLSRSRDFMSALRQTPSWTSHHWLWLCEAGEQHLKCYWFKRTVLTSYVKSITHQHNLCDCIKNTTNNNDLEISCYGHFNS